MHGSPIVFFSFFLQEGTSYLTDADRQRIGEAGSSWHIGNQLEESIHVMGASLDISHGCKANFPLEESGASHNAIPC